RDCRDRSLPMPPAPASSSPAIPLRHKPTARHRSALARLRRRKECSMFIEVPDESEVDDEVADWYARQRAAWGYLPNYAPAFALRPNVAEAWNALNKTVSGNMDRRLF